MAWSTDGTGEHGWERESTTVPILSTHNASTWEKDVIYQPNLVAGTAQARGLLAFAVKVPPS